ncbi:hypothetical protein ABK658_21320 [Enterobacter roggenkampii]|uniref:hypothetical protein n=1 Tax=Enterobacter roggenkampii TaxID=1812935 RepID=UPI001E633986|nr:hypothetical protein [Enterobacter roggenkampii]MCC7581541.1 hypothetical protein [Enterobacter roggenkampii]MCC7590901.1 hypothetical protein [Enterobacter roggenkampii]MCC7595451.1 hypothetical protein [Enterobacter roggenkampii]MCC7605109.1 hypothetical protein [Enterobacter roggenkampii]MCC7610120.1 hypothetical protein [Enterobacter roggenkampii]
MTLKTWLLLGVELLLSGVIIFMLLGQVSEQRGRAEKAEQEVDGQRQVIATQTFNINRFNQIADYTNRNNSLIDASSDNTVIEYREILRREKTCDLPVPADVAGGLLEYTHRLRASAMHTDSGNADAASDGATSTSSLTYCQAVLWLKPLLAAIEKANNQLAGVREIESSRKESQLENLGSSSH